MWDLRNDYLWMLVYFKQGTPHGPSLTWDEGGWLWQNSTYIDGVQQGTASLWRADGSLEATAQFEDGELVGFTKR